MKFILAIGLIIICIRDGFTQMEDLLKLPAYTDLSEVEWVDNIYLFPEFNQSKILFSTGFSTSEEFLGNYNLYFGTIDFINGEGDTLQVTPTKLMSTFDIGGHTFYLATGYGYIQILQQGTVSLGVHRILNSEIIGSGLGKERYERSPQYRNRSGKFAFHDPGIPYKYLTDYRGERSGYDRYYRKSAWYYFIDKEDRVFVASKYSILKIFRGHKKEINEYLQQNDTEFSNEHDLRSLLTFCASLWVTTG